MEDGRLIMDPASEHKMSFVHPWLAHLARVLDDYLTRCGIPIMVAQGLRSWADQLADWMKGRDEQGNIVDQRLVVTNAPPGHSMHEYGLALDVLPVAFVKLPDWGTGRPEWDILVAAAERLGLVSGSHFVHPKPDWPHIQLKTQWGISPTDEMRQLFKDGGLNAVWKAAKIEAQS